MRERRRWTELRWERDGRRKRYKGRIRKDIEGEEGEIKSNKVIEMKG